MKLLNLLAVLLLCATAFAQASVQCSSATLPCMISIQASLCGSFPCAINVKAGNKFNLGDRVVVVNATPEIAVRLTPALSGALIGTQPNGRTGLVVAGPVTDTAGDNKVRYQIDYAIGVDGWSIQDYLAEYRGAPAPAVSVAPIALTFTAPLNTDSAIQLVTLTNPGTSSVPLLNVLAGTGFAYGGIGNCPSDHIAPGTCTISLKYRPATTGAVLGTLTINAGMPNKTTLVNLSGSAAAAVTKSVLLKWNAPVTDGAASYNLYRTLSGGTLAKVGNVVGSVLTFTDATVPSGTYQYVARTVDSSGRESPNSNIATVTIP